MKYVKLTKIYLKECCNLLVDTFLTREPLTMCLNLDKIKFYEICNEMILGFIKQDLSYIAIHDEKVVALLLTRDESIPHINECFIAKTLPELFAIFSLENYLYKELNCTIEKKSCVHFEIAVCNKDYTNKGIIKKLIRYALDNSINQGYEYIMALCTGNVSQHIFKSLNHKYTVSSTNPQNHKYNNKYVFKNYPSSNNCELIYGRI